jgi:hypothetical protein
MTQVASETHTSDRPMLDRNGAGFGSTPCVALLQMPKVCNLARNLLKSRAKCLQCAKVLRFCVAGPFVIASVLAIYGVCINQL